jgi:hypothetical protein
VRSASENGAIPDRKPAFNDVLSDWALTVAEDSGTKGELPVERSSALK